MSKKQVTLLWPGPRKAKIVRAIRRCLPRKRCACGTSLSMLHRHSQSKMQKHIGCLFEGCGLKFVVYILRCALRALHRFNIPTLGQRLTGAWVTMFF